MKSILPPSVVPHRGWRKPLAATLATLVGLGTMAVMSQASASAAESSPIGWAAQSGGTTGGAGGATVTVTTASALDTALQSNSPLVIRVSGMISLTGMHHVKSNKSILGVGAGSGIVGGGLAVDGVRNVIIRNLTMKGSNVDAIVVDNKAQHVWIDHNDLSNAFDGLVDVRIGSDFVTVSWNHVHNHDKDMLLGAADTNGGTDIGHLRVTYHHNWFDGTNQRNPRVRFANPVHVFNNYYLNNKGYGVSTNTQAGVLVERNYFENVPTPTMAGSGTSPKGSLKLLNNVTVGSGTLAAFTPEKVAAIPYKYTPDSETKVKAIVKAGAGVGKIGL